MGFLETGIPVRAITAPAQLDSSRFSCGCGECANGGARIDMGIDSNGNNVLEDEEVTDSVFVNGLMVQRASLFC